MVQTPRLLLISFSFCCVALAQSDRDFSGRWLLKPEQSEIANSSGDLEKSIRIDQNEAVITSLRLTPGTPPEEIGTYFTDGRENRRTVGSTTFRSQTKWEGAALLISTNVSLPQGSYTISERWKLSGDRQRLTIRREIIRGSGGSESTLVYERQQSAQPPKFVSRAEPASPASPGNSVAPSESPRESSPNPVPAAPVFEVRVGTKIPLRLINSVNTKHSAVGDRVYLQTIYPILSHGRVIIPPGSYVTGSLAEVKQAGRVKGKSEFYLRFDSLTLPNGATRDFRSQMSGMDASGKGDLNRSEGVVHGDSGKGSDTKTVAGATAAGTSIGVLAGSAAGHLGMGAGIGAAAGALGGLAAVLATRGPDAVLERGSTVEMVLDRDLTFRSDEIGH